VAGLGLGFEGKKKAFRPPAGPIKIRLGWA